MTKLKNSNGDKIKKKSNCAKLELWQISIYEEEKNI